MADANVGPPEGWEAVALAGIPTVGYAFAPGEGWQYCNIGYAILGLAVARAARAHGKAAGLIELLQARLFAPLGMLHSGYRVQPGGTVAHGYVQSKTGAWDDTLPTAEEAGRGYRVPNGGVYSTVTDLAKLVGGLSATGPVEVLRPDSLAVMRADVASTAGPSAGTGASSYGLGLFTTEAGGGAGTCITYHGGATPGFTANMAFDAQTGWGCVILRNYAGGETSLGNVCIGAVRSLLKTEAVRPKL